MTDNHYAVIVRQRTKLINEYKSLTPDAKRVLQLMAVCYESMVRADILRLCHTLHQVDPKRYPKLADKMFKVVMSELTSKGVLVFNHGYDYSCHPLLMEVVTREVVETGDFEAMVEAIEVQLPITRLPKNHAILFRGVEQFMRLARWAIYRQQLAEIPEMLKMLKEYAYMAYPVAFEDVIALVFNNPFDEDWARTFPPELVELVLMVNLSHSVWSLAPAMVELGCVEEACLEPEATCGEGLLVCAAEQFILRNRLADAEYCLNRLSAPVQAQMGQYYAWIAFLRGDIDRAISLYEAAFQVLKKSSRKRKVFFEDLSGVFLIFALIQRRGPQDLRSAAEYAEVLATRKPMHECRNIYIYLGQLIKFLHGDRTQKALLANSLYGQIVGIDAIVAGLCLYWMDPKQMPPHVTNLLLSVYDIVDFAEYTWLEMEVAEILAKLRPSGDFAERAKELRAQSGTIPLISIVKIIEPWELSLTALTNLTAPTVTGTAAVPQDAQMRLAWFVTHVGNYFSVAPKEQKRNKNGSWAKGRPVALKRLSRSPSEFGYLLPQDRRVCNHINVQTYSSYYGSSDASYTLKETAFLELVGHPYVFWEGLPDARLEVVQVEPELLVKKDSKRNCLIVQLSPAITNPKQELAIQKETLTRLRVTKIQSSHQQIAQILGSANQLEVPIAAQDRVLSAIAAISGLVTVHSDIGGGMENVESVPSDPKPHVHLLPANDGLKAAILVRPFAIGGSYFHPGKGGETVIAEIDGKRLQTTRQLKEERKLAKAVQQDCWVLSEWVAEDGEWVIDEPSACLELLTQLQELGDRVTIEWPEGEKMRVKRQLSAGQFSMNIKRQRDWFEASGELKISHDDVLNMQELMTLLDQSTGRFIPLGDGEFIALTETFRKQLENLRVFSEKSGKGVRFHPLAALALEDTLDEMGELKVDKAWKEQREKLQAAKNHKPKLPKTLKAELRDYQLEGFKWLAQLAHWGVGACLADDMGLGKTLQALALILTRSQDGPTLVIAPLSVCMNWLGEVAKFAPSLNVIQLGLGDRQGAIDGLQPQDLMICSYGLLQQEEVGEMLAGVEWQTIVLDEAQAIKNPQTKRSQAAMKLQAGFKLITTGTPIENHLGELWNLFRFINPGLLGSLESFNQKYAGPIEREQDEDARDRLKQLIQPFMLRRKKDEVLAELPSRTEILLQVELSKEETAFYEALRQESIRKLTDSDAAPGTKHLQVLAEIMKLRRACCNPALVKPKVKIKSSKLELFGETLEELLDNGHKALVFSQFVDHLAILKDYLNDRQIPYQYLDGQTPAKQRKQRVDAFQEGEGDVFLISLKAGGTGLNLTAADYVIHMDPWWNPAVEDQASDRAHRIGQQRPVTIYRLVAKGTIEDQIVDLHHQKRDLANSLLEGADMSSKVSTDDLLRLIQAG
jgi:superfamily II DNA or RNA helicase